jgi:DNA-binding MarR family transcriptional regulator
VTTDERAARRVAPEIPPLGEVLDFMRSIWALDHSLQRASKRMTASHGITGPQRLVLRIVGRFPGILPGQLADILHIHPSTVTGIVDRLARRGLVSRQSDPRDRRRTRLGLTSRGRALDVTSSGTIEAAVMETFKSLPAGKVRVTEEVLSLLTSELDQISLAERESP